MARPMMEQETQIPFYRTWRRSRIDHKRRATPSAGESVSTSGKKKRTTTKASSSKPGASPKRKAAVFLSLMGMLTLTSALLMALAPAPLTPGAASSLFAVEAPASLDVVFDTASPVSTGRWKYIYIHHSRTASGNASTLGVGPGGMADHFLIGNGDGCADGEMQIAQRWNRQQSAGRVPGLDAIDPACVSVCLVGDFDKARPTATQQRRLAQLVSALQSRLDIPAERVVLVQSAEGAAGIGRHFDAAEFRRQLLP
jgi:hypothetical protein